MREPLPCTIQLSSILLMISDLLVLAGTLAISAVLWYHQGNADTGTYIRLFMLTPVVLLVYGRAGLYQGAVIFPGAALGPAEELRRLIYATGVVVLIFGTFCFFDEDLGYHYSHLVLLTSGLAWMILIPASRFGMRKLLSHFNRWGIPAVVIGEGELASRMMATLKAHPEYGVNPMGYVANNASLPDFRYLGSPDKLVEIARGAGISYGIFIVENNDDQTREVVNRHLDHFRHLLIVQKSGFSSAAWIQPKDLGGILGLEIHHNLLFPGMSLIKNAIDYALALTLTILLLPLFVVLALLVKLDSRGPVFFTQERIGRKGQAFRVWKFRTMQHGAEAELEQLFDKDASLRDEWAAACKLKTDPRITRLGSCLRKTSLDELPQLWNILRGQMTLVGPRPITPQEVSRYGDLFKLYKKVRPGLTGLWQVSGRSELSYEERVQLDVRYINNWSPWLDLYILLKTVCVVLCRKGAV